MTYAVKWQPAARNELAELWMTASSERRRKITAAARDVDSALGHSPQDVGESREERTTGLLPTLGLILLLTWPIGIVWAAIAANSGPG